MPTTDHSHSAGSTAPIVGALLIVVSVPLAFFALLLGSGGEMIAFESTADHIRLAALLSFPVLLFAVGCALLWSGRRRRYRLSFILGLLIPIDVAAIAGTFWLLNQPQSPVVIPPSNPHELIGAAAIPQAQVPRPPAIVRESAAIPPGCPRKSEECDVATVAALETSRMQVGRQRRANAELPPATSAARP